MNPDIVAWYNLAVVLPSFGKYNLTPIECKDEVATLQPLIDALIDMSKVMEPDPRPVKNQPPPFEDDPPAYNGVVDNQPMTLQRILGIIPQFERLMKRDIIYSRLNFAKIDPYLRSYYKPDNTQTRFFVDRLVTIGDNRIYNTLLHIQRINELLTGNGNAVYYDLSIYGPLVDASLVSFYDKVKFKNSLEYRVGQLSPDNRAALQSMQDDLIVFIQGQLEKP